MPLLNTISNMFHHVKCLYTLIFLTFLCFFWPSNSLHAQNFSPFVFPLKQTNSWDAIKLFNDTLYFSIGNNIQSEGFSNRIIKVSKDLRYGVVSNFLPYSSEGKLFNGNNELIWCNRTQDYKNTYNTQFSVFNLNNKKIGPVIVGDTSNYATDINVINNDILLSGYYRPPTSQFGLSGFLARYNIDGSKIWEKYYRINRDGFRTTSFDYVYHTKNNEILVIGKSQKDSAGRWQTKVISALFDTSGNLLEIKSELDSLGWQYDFVFDMFRLPRLYYNSSVQLNDSTYGLLVYNQESQLKFPARWVFFNDKGNVISHRKAWMYRDTVNYPFLFNSSFKGLVKRINGDDFLALTFFNDSIDRQRMIVLDNELFIKKVLPGIAEYDRKNSQAGLSAFAEDDEKNFYQLRFLAIDSITELDYYGSLVCKIDSNGKLLSNGPLFPVGLNPIGYFNDILVYPNPVNHEVNISSDKIKKVDLEIFGVESKLLYNDTFSGNYQFHMDNFPSGLYFLRLSDEYGNSLTRKIIRN